MILYILLILLPCFLLAVLCYSMRNISNILAIPFPPYDNGEYELLFGLYLAYIIIFLFALYAYITLIPPILYAILY